MKILSQWYNVFSSETNTSVLFATLVSAQLTFNLLENFASLKNRGLMVKKKYNVSQTKDSYFRKMPCGQINLNFNFLAARGSWSKNEK